MEDQIMRRKGFTLVELLVVIGIIALLVSILMPALGRAKELAKQIMCSSQLNGLGKAMMIYQNDNKERNPKNFTGNGEGNDVSESGFGAGRYSLCGQFNIKMAYLPSLEEFYQQYQTAGSCLYLLVKHTDVTPKAFLCPSAPNDEEMDLNQIIDAAYSNGEEISTWEELNDFISGCNLSYSYNDPWSRHLDSSASASIAVMADKSWATDYENPSQAGGRSFLINPAAIEGAYRPLTGDGPDIGLPGFTGTWDDTPLAGSTEPNLQHGNSNNHQTEVQNVLYVDTHVSKEQSPCVGVNEDNIYTFATTNVSTNPNNIFSQYMYGNWGRGMISSKNIGDNYSYDDTIGPDLKDSFMGN